MWHAVRAVGASEKSFGARSSFDPNRSERLRYYRYNLTSAMEKDRRLPKETLHPVRVESARPFSAGFKSTSKGRAGNTSFLLGFSLGDFLQSHCCELPVSRGRCLPLLFHCILFLLSSLGMRRSGSSFRPGVVTSAEYYEVTLANSRRLKFHPSDFPLVSFAGSLRHPLRPVRR